MKWSSLPPPSPVDENGKRRFSTLSRGKPMERTRMKRTVARRVAARAAWDPLGRWLRVQPCACCGRLPRLPRTREERQRKKWRTGIEAAHMTLSRNEKGMGMKVNDGQRVSLCGGPRGCHRQWDGHRGRFAGWGDAERYEQAGAWLADVRERTTPGVDDKTHALDLQAAGLGTLNEKPDGSWSWTPGDADEQRKDAA